MAPGNVDDEVYSYDVHMTGTPPESLRARYPGMTVRTTQAQTALRRQVDGPEGLDALLCEIGTVGLTLTDVHRVTTTSHDPSEPAPAACATYEVRVVGELGKPLLRHLRCAHYSIPKLTLVRLRLVAGELGGFLEACTDCGAQLERVRRVSPPHPQAG